MAEKKTIKRKLTGNVVGVKMEKTIVVEVESMKVHSKYNKRYKINKKYLVHDEKNEAQVGDKVIFTECRPISKNKRWYLSQIIKK